MTRTVRAFCLAAGVALAAVPAAAQSPGAEAPAAAPAETAIAVEPDAPRGSSGEVAKGAAIGLVVGLVLVLLIGASASSD
jgi:hypothetical protein